MMQDFISKSSTGGEVDQHVWLTPREVAARLRVHPGTLANWRHQGIGPRYTKLSSAPSAPVRYRSDHIDEYLAGNEGGAAA
ncbi:helix-turn-helix domain-containing protein [Streptomyces sp. NPDC020817]|uniref:helix-turn-helix domain-containing protein n=1 Tax=Streptomyces sp. NPDC020817 TaxID=3365095 RepID=UPI0037B0FBAC